MKNKARIIFHIDLNMFFCSVAVIKNPSLKGKAFAIGRENTYKGVISTASYEARKYGIHSAMPIIEAYKKLPSLIILNGDYQEYKKYQGYFINLIKEYTDVIEVASIDELYADMTELCQKRNALDIASEIQRRLVKEYKLPCSIGIAPTLFLAKMASDIKKPMGITVLRKREVDKILYPLDVGDIFGIGKKTSPKLINIGINTIGDFMNVENKEKIIAILGQDRFDSTYNAIIGNSSDIVDPNRYQTSESVSLSQTYDYRLNDFDDILLELRKMAIKLHKSIKHDGYLTKTITITLRNTDFKTITRSKTIEYTDDLFEINDTIEELLENNYHNETLRLVGVGFSNLRKSSDIEIEYNLFTYQSIIEKEEKLRNIMKEFNSKYGDSFITKGVETKDKMN
ncbi:MAG: DNA polymerase IV [Anaeroplasmataceae bacterium]